LFSFSKHFIWKTYSGYIPGIFLEYPCEEFIPSIYLVHTRKKLSGIPDVAVEL
jgi:hypothetical protein